MDDLASSREQLSEEVQILRARLFALEEERRETQERCRILAALTSDYTYAFQLRPDGAMVRQWTTDALARITAQRQVEQAHRESEERYRRIVETSTEGIWLVDAAWKTTFVNARLAQMLGWEPSAMLGRHILDFADEESRQIARRNMERREQGIKEVHDFKFRRRDGTFVWTMLSTNPILDDAGHFVGALAMVTDITERQQAEQKLREYTQRLQTLSRRLVEVQEEERRRLARELHDEVGQQLTGLTFMLQQSAALGGEAARAKLEEAQTLVDRLLARVRDLSSDLRPALLDHLGLLPALLWHFEHYASQTGVRVQFQHAGLETRFAPDVETAAYRMVQEALTNVARHAHVSAATVRAWVDANLLTVQVEDQGVGFDAPAVLSAGHTSGLAGMQERVTSLRGHLLIDSEPGAGTHLTAQLPL